MKITNNNFRINKLYQQIRKPESLQKNSVEKKSEAVILSADAGKIAEAVKLVMQMDDVRLERVQELQAKMKAGNYRVDPEELAEAMLSQDK
ncbi:MAG: flagellar biosynthesis anti-sigma factor FlgM [Firmicutes bacterium]|nr:flagellar biosynthesis anti-sigma factor FlgM [Bacillota bacterium]